MTNRCYLNRIVKNKANRGVFLNYMVSLLDHIEETGITELCIVGILAYNCSIN
ncbi:unnamed protein product [Moneuplotes crassus]|uniref:Uncharacterized protein n=1 Tax=Euplotes crassus TaxID=5936 RepID=A0AAD1Y726_EUPCR|nr:unnamed protein product [Moneuplotes crassus]